MEISDTPPALCLHLRSSALLGRDLYGLGEGLRDGEALRVRFKLSQSRTS